MMSVKSSTIHNPDSKDHGANMGPTWVLSAPGGPHLGPMNLAIREPMNHGWCLCFAEVFYHMILFMLCRTHWVNHGSYISDATLRIVGQYIPWIHKRLLSKPQQNSTMLHGIYCKLHKNKPIWFTHSDLVIKLIKISNGLDNGLVPFRDKPLSEPMLTQITDIYIYIGYIYIYMHYLASMV